MTPVIAIKPKDRQSVWLVLDMRDEDEIEAVLVLPAFGPNHHAGMDCWCQPTLEQVDHALIVHNAQN